MRIFIGYNPIFRWYPASVTKEELIADLEELGQEFPPRGYFSISQIEVEGQVFSIPYQRLEEFQEVYSSIRSRGISDSHLVDLFEVFGENSFNQLDNFTFYDSVEDYLNRLFRRRSVYKSDNGIIVYKDGMLLEGL